MKLACNYYRETEELVRDGKIDIDYFKFPALGFQMGICDKGRESEFEAFASRVTGLKPVLLHGLYPAPHDLASPTLTDDFDFETADRLIRLTKTPGLSFHPTFTFPDPAAPIAETLDNIIRNIRFIKHQYADMRFVSVENVDSNRYGELIKPEVLKELVNAADCDFLLDISHAFCASRWLGMELMDYIRRLPLEKISEIHINGWIVKGDRVMCHTKINETGYSALSELLAISHPNIITIEYGRGDDYISAGIPLLSPDKVNDDAKAEIVEQVGRIKKIVNNT
jgi:uncharacterized protein (UPF0276 family)